MLAGHVRTLAQQAAASQKPEHHLAATIAEALRHHSDRFPALSATMASAATDGAQDQAFEFGLDRILDGLDMLIAHRRQRPA
ncbi:TetR/AcrR family transcriptional regulator C-terminal domain-containing protein [Micromonospora deserti]|uniref:TetR/AcrR family transcriptional regulator C-terminal domain-containing protein n=1 Tax=Micromonospora deserti TaxID=2070366 RepID=UPI0022788A1A|nr:TetR/AcrR family transcriptional regulator C-terminal domain-containing protein [Micromonospora deserti]